MAYDMSPVWQFNDENQTGIYQVPLNTPIYIKSIKQFFTKISNDGITSDTKLSDILNNTNILSSITPSGSSSSSSNTSSNGAATTIPPTLSVYNVSIKEFSRTTVNITNYNSVIAYTVTSSNNYVSATHSNGVITIVGNPVSSDQTATINVVATAPGLNASSPTAIDVTVKYLPIVGDDELMTNLQSATNQSSTPSTEFITSISTQESADKDWMSYQELVQGASNTIISSSPFAVLDTIPTGTNIAVVDSNGNAQVINASSVTPSTLFVGYSCEYDYYNKYNKYNLLKNTTVNDITGWTTSTTIPGNLAVSQVIVTSSRVYLMSGWDGNGEVKKVYTAQINSDGTLGAWTTGTDLPSGFGHSQAITTKSRVYLLGGWDGNNPLSVVYTAPINSDGTLGAWTAGTNLPGALLGSQAIITKSRVYLLGGGQGRYDSSSTIVYTAPINSDGTLGTWTTDSNSLPGTLSYSQAIVTKSRVYLLGGWNGNAVSTVYTAPINSDGTIGSWAVGTSLPGVLFSSQAVVTKSRVYLLGGGQGGWNSASTTVYTAPINSDGTLGTWTTGTSLPGVFSYSQIIATKSRVYLCGGIDSSNKPISTVYTAPFADGWTIMSNDYSVPPTTKITDPTPSITPDKAYIIPNVYTRTGTDTSSCSNASYVQDTNPIATYTNVPKTTATNLLYSADTTNAIVMGDVRGGTVYIEDNNSTTGFTGVSVSNNATYGVNPFANNICAFDYYTQYMRQNILQNTTVNDITSWSTGTSLPGVLATTQAIVTKSRVYLLGGYNGSSSSSTVYTAPINSDGTLGSWSNGTSLLGNLHGHQAVVTKSKVYLLGGYNGSNYVSTVYTAPINSDGTLGSWSTGTSLPGALAFSQSIVTKSRVYLLGGNNGNAVATVYTAPINSDGTLGSWSTGTSLPGALYSSQAIVTNSRIYLLGGNNGNVVATVYTTPINSDGTLGSWTTDNSLPGALAVSQAVVTNSRVYLLGGNDGNNSLSKVYTAPINSDGTLGSWITGTSLPGALSHSQAIIIKSRVYLLSGYNGSSYVSTVYTAPFADGWSITSNDYTTIIPATQFPHNLTAYNGTAQTPQSAFVSSDMESNITISFDQIAPSSSFRAIQRKLTSPVTISYRFLTTRLNKGN
jgi:hypothetical protein